MSESELQEFRANPLLEQKRGITTYVVCRVCGAKLKRLIGGYRSHLEFRDNTNPEQYHQDFPGAPTFCPGIRAKMSQARRREARARHGKPFSGKVRGHGARLRPWPVISALTSGTNYAAMERLFGRNPSTLFAIGKKVGLKRPAFYDFDDPITRVSLATLGQSTGLTIEELKKLVPINPWYVVNAFGSSPERSEGHSVQGEIAKKIIVWRDNVIRKLAGKTQRCRGYQASQVLKTFFPRLKTKRRVLLDALTRSRRFLRENSGAAIEQWQDFVVQQATLAQKPFVQFLPWAPQISPLIEKNLARIRGTAELWRLASEILAARWNATPKGIETACKSGTRQIPPREMRLLILAMVPDKQLSPQKQKPGRKPRSILDKANELHQNGLSWRKITTILDPRGYEINPNAAMEAIRVGAWRRRKPQKMVESFVTPVRK